MADESRINLHASFVCADCGDQLKIRSGLKNTECKSAYDISYKVHVVPCPTCIATKTRPARAIAEAIKEITEVDHGRN